MPEHAADYWINFPESVKRRLMLKWEPVNRKRFWWPIAAWSLIAAVCGIVLGFAIWHRPPSAPDAFEKLKNGQALRETMALYLGRLQAIEQDGNGLHLVLSKTKDVPMSVPVWVEIYDGRQHRALITFSGQSFLLGNERIQVLANPDGQVILVGEGFLWSTGGKASTPGGARVEAQLLSREF